MTSISSMTIIYLRNSWNTQLLLYWELELTCVQLGSALTSMSVLCSSITWPTCEHLCLQSLLQYLCFGWVTVVQRLCSCTIQEDEGVFFVYPLLPWTHYVQVTVAQYPHCCHFNKTKKCTTAAYPCFDVYLIFAIPVSQLLCYCRLQGSYCILQGLTWLSSSLSSISWLCLSRLE